MAELGLICAVALAAFVQRSTGFGFALVSAPFFVFVLGPVHAPTMTSICSAPVCLILTLQHFKDVDWSRMAHLTAWSVPGVLVGTYLSHLLTNQVLGCIVPAVILAFLLVSQSRLVRTAKDTPALRCVSGLLCGSVTSIAGVGGPALVVYGQITRWSGSRQFTSTLQPIFLVVNITVIASRTIGDGYGLASSLRVDVWTMVVVGLLAGLGLGQVFRDRLSPQLLRTFTFVLAYAGTLAALGRGIHSSVL